MRLAFCLGNAEESDSLVVTVVKAAAPMRSAARFQRICHTTSPPPPPTPSLFHHPRRRRRHRTCSSAVGPVMWPPRPPEMGRLAAIREGYCSLVADADHEL